MKVLFDVSVLGTGYRAEPARTGVFRVVEQTAVGLANRADVDLRLTATESWENRYWVRRLAEKHLELSRVPFAPMSTTARAIDSANRYLWPETELAAAQSNRPFGYRALRRLTDAISNRAPTISRAQIRSNDILHSGMYAFPFQSQGLATTQRVITIYDLIPVKFPELFAQGMALTVKKIFDEMLKSLGASDFFLCISEATKQDLCQHLNVEPSRTAVTPPAASKELFFPVVDRRVIQAAKSRYKLPCDAQYLLSVNTLEPRKNIPHAIRAFSELVQAEQIPDLYFVLAGTNGWQYDDILTAVADCNLAIDRVIVTGYVPDVDLAPLYSGALAFVYPSFYEGFGLPPLEAMQCGTPVITSNTSALPEVVGDAGILVDPRDGAALSAAMLTLYHQPDVRALLAEKSVERARLFSWDRYTDSVVAGYEAALRK